MKVCIQCKKEKLNSLFKNRSLKCNACRWINTKPKVIPSKQAEAVRKHQQKIRDEVNSYKESRPCTDCFIFWPYYVMEFDHLKDKLFDVSQGIGSVSYDKLWKEIAKCELVCANCHRIRTYLRKQK